MAQTSCGNILNDIFILFFPEPFKNFKIFLYVLPQAVKLKREEKKKGSIYTRLQYFTTKKPNNID